MVQAVKEGAAFDSIRNALEKCEQRKAALEHQRDELSLRRPEKTAKLSEREITSALTDLSNVLESGTPRDRKVILEENIEEIIVQPTGETILKANPAGLLPPAGKCAFTWCRRWDSNRREKLWFVLQPAADQFQPYKPN